MSHHPIEELIARWRGEKMTTEQMVGQLLLTVQALEQRQRTLERQLAALPTPPPAAEPPATATKLPEKRTPSRKAR